jgi:hypothetical protein
MCRIGFAAINPYLQKLAGEMLFLATLVFILYLNHYSVCLLRIHQELIFL